MDAFLTGLMAWPTQDHFGAGVLAPLVVSLTILWMRKRLGFDSLGNPWMFLVATTLTIASGFFGAETNPAGKYIGVHLAPIYPLFLLAACVASKKAPNAWMALAGTFFSLLAADIVVAATLGIGIEWVGGYGWADSLVRAPLIMSAIVGGALPLIAASKRVVTELRNNGITYF